MCTSFVLHRNNTFIGMNFDISERPIKLSLVNGEQFIVYQKEGVKFFPAFGINRRGIFMNLLMVAQSDAGQYRRSKDVVHIIKLFEGLLGGQISPQNLDELLAEKTVVNVPKISVHSIVVGESHQAWVIEPGRGEIRLDQTGKDHLALTNFPLMDFFGKDCEVSGYGAMRYQTCMGMLANAPEDFSVAQGFEILAATAQADGDFPTQMSMMAVPEDEKLWFCVQRDFLQRYEFSFADQTLRVEGGKNFVLDKKGILLSELKAA